MSAIFGETLTFTQHQGGDVQLVTFGDDKYARYETLDGYTVVYDPEHDGYCYAKPVGEGPLRRFGSTGVRLSDRPPEGLRRHLKEGPEYRRNVVGDRFAKMVPPEERGGMPSDVGFTFGANRGLLPGDRVSEGNVAGLTLLVTFPGTDSDVTPGDVIAMLNSPDYHANGNRCSVNEFFKTMSTGRLDFTNEVVGPYRLPRSKLAYANTEGLLVPDAIQAAVDDGVDFGRFDSQGRGIVDSLNIMYAGRTEYVGDLWPHNWVHRRVLDGTRTELYTVTAMGRNAADLSIGTYCHESGHLLCRWPDLYDYGTIEREGDDFTSAGLGNYCVMAAGDHLGRGRTPSAVCAYLRRLVDWCGEEVDLAAEGDFAIEQGAYDKVYVYDNPQRSNVEYFIIENRSRRGFDSALSASGLAVYHCDIKGSNEFQQGTLLKHYQCALVQADGHLDLETNRNQGDGSDLYGPGPGTALSHSSRPASLWWDGSESGLTLSEIGEPGPVITFHAGAHDDAAQALITGESSPDAPIPQEDPGGLTDAITLQGAGTVRELKVVIDIEHPHIGDLRVVLLSPTGRRAVLHNRTGGATKNLRLSLDSQPPSLLAALVGTGAAGPWALHITDAAQPAAGTLHHWDLRVRTGS